MRILIALSHGGFFRHFETVVSSLADRGHEVRVITRFIRKTGSDDELEYRQAMTASVAGVEGGSYDLGMIVRGDHWTLPVNLTRACLDYALYFRPQHNSPQLADRVASHCPRPVRAAVRTRAGRRLVAEDRFWRAARRAGALFPPDRGIAAQVAQAAPDVVVGCPFVYTFCNDVEYLRAAVKQGIRTVGVVGSWDNLTTKGAAHLLVDRVLVWNEPLADEAEHIHALPRDRIDVTGAAKFDAYFELDRARSREDFCARAGLDPTLPFVLYFGSSKQVAGDESGFVRDLAGCLRASSGLDRLQMVVRPHPLNVDCWGGFCEPGVAVFPADGARPDLERPRQDYFDTLTHSAAVVGVNTTAFLEAAVTDRPCLSIVSERHRQGQVERGHFHHLLDGGFIETSPDLEGAAAIVSRILGGEDPRRAQRRRFVGYFVRPGGMDRRAGEVVAEAIERAGRGGAPPAPPAAGQPDRALATAGG
jgi:hypothetical protein